MSFSVRTLPDFEKEAKRLAKKYPSFKSDLAAFIESLQANPNQGSSLGNDFYKIRLAIKSKAKGKSGGARIITFVKMIKSVVYLAAIYDKSDKENISDKELKWLAEIVNKL